MRVSAVGAKQELVCGGHLFLLSYGRRTVHTGRLPEAQKEAEYRNGAGGRAAPYRAGGQTKRCGAGREVGWLLWRIGLLCQVEGEEAVGKKSDKWPYMTAFKTSLAGGLHLKTKSFCWDAPVPTFVDAHLQTVVGLSVSEAATDCMTRQQEKETQSGQLWLSTDHLPPANRQQQQQQQQQQQRRPGRLKQSPNAVRLTITPPSTIDGRLQFSRWLLHAPPKHRREHATDVGAVALSKRPPR
ncbi:uncharacterized protein J3D65DRAFT_619467 [Phyllosticta citribraziliensis]|uniref:Uncharacterized protein n=1 Tax=Phyllosticta citribraziliensis TaxID=989973 RepID=A0ABR1LYG9_9PEZI